MVHDKNEYNLVNQIQINYIDDIFDKKNTSKAFENSEAYKILYKFPYISTEILSSELPIILEKFFPTENISLEESKYSFLNLSNDSFSNENKKKEELEPEDMFNPPDIECGSDYRDKNNEIIIIKESRENKENSLNISLDKKYNYTQDNNELLDYLFNYLGFINNYNCNLFQMSKYEYNVKRYCFINFFISLFFLQILF